MFLIFCIVFSLCFDFGVWYDLYMFPWDWQTQEYFIDFVYCINKAFIFSQFLIMSIKDVIFFFPTHTYANYLCPYTGQLQRLPSKYLGEERYTGLREPPPRSFSL